MQGIRDPPTTGRTHRLATAALYSCARTCAVFLQKERNVPVSTGCLCMCVRASECARRARVCARVCARRSLSVHWARSLEVVSQPLEASYPGRRQAHPHPPPPPAYLRPCALTRASCPRQLSCCCAATRQPTAHTRTPSRATHPAPCGCPAPAESCSLTPPAP